jgi:tetratricopeptide (TPR) repeat protein
MQAYRLRDVERLLGVSRRTILAFVRHGFVVPARGARNAYAFTFDDMVVLRVVRDLARASVPPERIARSLKRLRTNLGQTGISNDALRLGASGDRLVARTGHGPWQTEAGQFLLDFAIGPAPAVERLRHATADALFDEAVALESTDAEAAVALYRQALVDDPGAPAIAANLGRLLHELGAHEAAQAAYRAGLARTPDDPLLHFNLAVLLEDRGKAAAARRHYESALEADPALADAHYNLSLLLETTGERALALRHLRTYRRLLAGLG